VHEFGNKVTFAVYLVNGLVYVFFLRSLT